MKPSDRILALRKEIAQERLEMLKKTGSYQFMNSIVGGTDETAAETLEFDLTTSIAAILAYIDEREVAK